MHFTWPLKGNPAAHGGTPNAEKVDEVGFWIHQGRRVGAIHLGSRPRAADDVVTSLTEWEMSKPDLRLAIKTA